METALKAFFSSPRFAVAGASSGQYLTIAKVFDIPLSDRPARHLQIWLQRCATVE